MQQIKGSVIKSRLAFVEEHFGKPGLERLLGCLPAGDRRELGMVLAVKWYPFALGERLDDAIVHVLAAGDRQLFERLGARSGRLTPFGADTFSAPDCLTVVGWHRQALAMLGVAEPVVVEEECRAKGGAVCRYRLSWA